MPRFVRYFSLAGGNDADPIVTQPIVTDPKATPFGPMVTGLGGEVLVNGWEVDADGKEVTPTGSLVLTVGIVTLSRLEPQTRPPGSALTGAPSPMFRWGRGPLASKTEAGEWRIQTELGDVVGFGVVVTSHTVVAGRWLAFWATGGVR